MSDEDDILAIVAALELLQSRADTVPAQSKWKLVQRDDEALGPERTTWKNS